VSNAPIQDPDDPDVPIDDGEDDPDVDDDD